ncbi:MAG TPA: phytanoyl-CoA dioxygenase family protein [Polyangiaceae bacterium]|nr:phytanoyl-CoA dioxygenase family protein [Polyangiaceae bacterium]
MAQFERHARELSEQGVTLFEQVVPPELLEASKAAIIDFLGIDPSDPATFSRVPGENAGIVPLHHAAAFWAVRQHPPIHEIFSKLWGTQKLWVTMDRAGFRPPEATGASGGDVVNLHWDTDPDDANYFYQGMLYLNDAPPDRAPLLVGAGVFRELETFLGAPPPEFRPPDSMRVNVSPKDVVTVGGRAGDFVVWHSRAPHGVGPNLSAEPRYTQYVSMYPVAVAKEKADDRVALWQSKRPPPWWREGFVGQKDPEPGEPAPLSSLGRKLVGIDAWR